jgi:hypothetical protein
MKRRISKALSGISWDCDFIYCVSSTLGLETVAVKVFKSSIYSNWLCLRTFRNLGMHLIGIHFITMHLTGVHLMGMHLMVIHSTSMHLIGVHITSMCLMGEYLIGVISWALSHGRMS